MLSLLSIVSIHLTAQQSHSFNVKEFGAKADGIQLDTKAINDAISAAAKAGGGEVFLPAGNYLSGSIHLRSHIALYLSPGATLIAIRPPVKRT